MSYGICVNWCKKSLEVYPNSTQFLIPNSDGRFNALTDSYNDNINQCINHQLYEQYSLMAYSEVQYCDERSTSKDINVAGFLWIVFAATIILIIIIASCLDAHWRRKKASNEEDPDYYQKPLDTCKRKHSK